MDPSKTRLMTDMKTGTSSSTLRKNFFKSFKSAFSSSTNLITKSSSALRAKPKAQTNLRSARHSPVNFFRPNSPQEVFQQELKVSLNGKNRVLRLGDGRINFLRTDGDTMSLEVLHLENLSLRSKRELVLSFRDDPAGYVVKTANTVALKVLARELFLESRRLCSCIQFVLANLLGASVYDKLFSEDEASELPSLSGQAKQTVDLLLRELVDATLLCRGAISSDYVQAVYGLKEWLKMVQIEEFRYWETLFLHLSRSSSADMTLMKRQDPKDDSVSLRDIRTPFSKEEKALMQSLSKPENMESLASRIKAGVDYSAKLIQRQ